MTLFHCTTEKKMERYAITGAILPPVRGWSTIYAARRWCRRVGRSTILQINVDPSYPLPDHKPGGAYWSPSTVYSWEEVK